MPFVGAGGPDGSVDIHIAQLAECLSDLLSDHMYRNSSVQPTHCMRSQILLTAKTRASIDTTSLEQDGSSSGLPINQLPPSIAFIATCSAPTSLHPSLTLPSLFTHRIDLKPPNASGRCLVLRKLLHIHSDRINNRSQSSGSSTSIPQQLQTSDSACINLAPRLEVSPALDYDSISADMEGYTFEDINQVLQRVSVIFSIKRSVDAKDLLLCFLANSVEDPSN